MQENYELVLILKASMDADAQKKLLGEVRKQIDAFSGKVTKEEEMGKRVLAYRIRKEKEGYYFILSVGFPREKIKTLSEKIRVNDNVLRYLVLRKE